MEKEKQQVAIIGRKGLITIRLWHYKLIPVLDDKHLISCWRECIAIKRQWEKGTLKHRLVSYVMDYDKTIFMGYVYLIVGELNERNIKWQQKYWNELLEFCDGIWVIPYKEHNDRYLKQCYYNLQEKYDRGIITDEEWKLIEDNFKEELK